MKALQPQTAQHYLNNTVGRPHQRHTDQTIRVHTVNDTGKGNNKLHLFLQALLSH